MSWVVLGVVDRLDAGLLRGEDSRLFGWGELGGRDGVGGEGVGLKV